MSGFTPSFLLSFGFLGSGSEPSQLRQKVLFSRARCRDADDFGCKAALIRTSTLGKFNHRHFSKTAFYYVNYTQGCPELKQFSDGSLSMKGPFHFTSLLFQFPALKNGEPWKLLEILHIHFKICHWVIFCINQAAKLLFVKPWLNFVVKNKKKWEKQDQNCIYSSLGWNIE